MDFLDANVALEIILNRKYRHRAEEVVRSIKGQPHISMSSVHLVVYFSRRLGATFPDIFKTLDRAVILDLTLADYQWAKLNMRNNDFEDALQLAVAIRNGCSTFLTLDKTLYSTYKTLPQLRVQLIA